MTDTELWGWFTVLLGMATGGGLIMYLLYGICNIDDKKE